MTQNNLTESWWTIEDTVQRRRAQNRLNKRSSRQRYSQKSPAKALVIRPWMPKADPGYGRQMQAPTQPCELDGMGDTEQSGSYCTSAASEKTQPEVSHQSLDLVAENSEAILEGNLAVCEQTLADRYPEVIQERLLNECRSALQLSADHLLTLTYYNVLRGLVWNTSILGLNPFMMAVDDYRSPFPPLSPTGTSALVNLPYNLRPTVLQQRIDHHPYIDIFPCPVVRDNVLKLEIAAADGDNELCDALYGISAGGVDLRGRNGDRLGPSVWGDPWLIESWEISEQQACGWSSVFKGALMLESHTNQRRTIRGWRPIQFA